MAEPVVTDGESSGTPLQYSCLETPMDGGAWWATVHGVAKSRTRLSDFTFTCHFHALEKEMATHSSVLAWRIPGMGEPGGLPSTGSHRVGHDWSNLAAAAVTEDLEKQSLMTDPKASLTSWLPISWISTFLYCLKQFELCFLLLATYDILCCTATICWGSTMCQEL